MVSGYGFDDRARQGQEIFSSSLCVQTGSGVHPASCKWVPGVLSLRLKRGRGVTLTITPSSTEVVNE
jgi:hypothetical protein